jgi:DNA-binding MarR family transcriptional regulator
MSHTIEAPAAEVHVDLGTLSGQIGYALRRAQAAVFQDFVATLEAADIRPAQYSVLEVLRASPGLRQAQVSAALGIKTTNFVPLFDALEAAGLAERRAVSADRRAKGLFLSDKGTATLDRLHARVAEHEARFTARIGAEGKGLLLGLLARLQDPAFG